MIWNWQGKKNFSSTINSLRQFFGISYMHGRLRTLFRLAQAAPAAPTTPAASAAQTTPTTVSGSPRPFDPASVSPTLVLGWGANNLNFIRRLVSILSQAIFIASNGKLDYSRLYDQSFGIDASAYSPLVGALAEIGKLVFRTMIKNNGYDFTAVLPTANRTRVVNMLTAKIQAPAIPDGAINPTLYGKIGGNLRTVLLDIVRQIKIK
jgi:hypothetical protein